MYNFTSSIFFCIYLLFLFVMLLVRFEIYVLWINILYNKDSITSFNLVFIIKILQNIRQPASQ